MSFDVVHRWTNGFREELDRGAFGIVYKGLVTFADSSDSDSAGNGGRYVAVKVFNTDALAASIAATSPAAETDGDDIGGNSNGNSSVFQSVAREINVLSSFNHPNIIRLMGYSLPTAEQRRLDDIGSVKNTCLVYEYATHGGLHKVLQDPAQAAELTWFHRVKIALGVAKGLSYMHNRDRERPAFHRDIKAANIALTQHMVPKIIDCGLAKYVPETNKAGMSIHTATGSRFGTPGYTCDRYSKRANVPYDVKCDIFSFGVVLLELYTGQLQGSNHDYLLEQMLGEDGLLLPDERMAIGTRWPEEAAKQFIQLASECVAMYPKRRSDMRAVVSTLSDICSLHQTTALESSLLRAHEHMVMENERLRLQLDVSRHVQESQEKESMHDCCVCLNNFPRSSGVLCDGDGAGNHHFFCNDDLDDMTTNQCSDLGVFVKFGCKVVCAGCKATPVARGEPQVGTEIKLSTLAAHVTDAALASFVDAGKAAELQLEERKNQARLDKVREQHADEMQVWYSTLGYVG